MERLSWKHCSVEWMEGHHELIEGKGIAFLVPVLAEAQTRNYTKLYGLPPFGTLKRLR
jgi:hypothetical protein